MTLLKRLNLLLLVSAAVVFSQASLAQNRLVSGGFLFSNYEITGSGYNAIAESEMLIGGIYSHFLKPEWRMQLAASASFAGEYLAVSAGASYHFIPLFHGTSLPADNVSYKVISTWSPYVGMDLGFTRVQLSLDRSNSDQTDAIIGGLTGPVLRGGTFYSLNKEWSVQAEFSIGYAFSPEVATSSRALSVYMTYFLP